MPASSDSPRVAVFSTKPYDQTFLEQRNAASPAPRAELVYFDATLTAATAPLAAGCVVVCGFVHDHFDAAALDILARSGVRLVALRCAGFNNVDLGAAARLGITVVRVPAYSPHAVAEHTIGLILNLDRKLHRALNRVREGNFALDGLLGGELYQRPVGVVGTGEIGHVVARILVGFGARVMAFDPRPSDEVRAMGVTYLALDELLAASEIVTLHCPLNAATRHLINQQRIAAMRDGALVVNTGRGGLLDTPAVIDALKSRKLGGLAIDVYEEEEGLFFQDHSSDVIADDVFARLLTFPNVLVTGHQAFFTAPALTAIAETTLDNIRRFFAGEANVNAVKLAGAA